MIDNETEKEILISAYVGTSSSYQATYSFQFESPAYEQKYSEAISSLKDKNLIDPQHVYSSFKLTHSICSITRQGVDYVENNGLVEAITISNHKQARKLIQEIDDAESLGNFALKDNLYSSFQNFSSETQASAKQYKHLI